MAGHANADIGDVLIRAHFKETKEQNIWDGF